MGSCFSSAAPPSSTPPAAPAKPDFGLDKYYEVDKLLGVGGEGETWLCVDKQTNKQVAIKLMRRPIPRPMKHITLRSIQIQAELGHGHLNIVRADEVVLTKSHIGLVMEYIAGGSMVQYVGGKVGTMHARGGVCLDEDEACYYFKQLISAVEYCHNHNVAHRDLKLDNALMDDSVPPRMKLCDFGFAKQWNQGATMDTLYIGTAEYMGPELIGSKSGYDGKKVDIWACGVILFVMLFGKFPFEAENQNSSSTVMLHNLWLKQLKTSWEESLKLEVATKNLTPDCVDLLGKIFDVNAETRIGMEGLKAHPWFNRPLPEPYATSLESMQKKQASFKRVPTLGKASMNSVLEGLVDKAAQPPMPTEEVIRIKLIKDVTSNSPLSGNGIVETEEEPPL